MTETYPVRRASLEDATQIKKIINEAFRPAENFFVDGDRISLEEVKRLLDHGDFLLAEQNDRLLGSVYIEPRGERAYLGLLSVDPKLQKSGLGSLLMNAAEEYCRQRECRFIDIYVVNLRQELPGFYRKRGYVETGTEPFPSHVVTKVPCHFIAMSKSLVQHQQTSAD